MRHPKGAMRKETREHILNKTREKTDRKIRNGQGREGGEGK